LDRQRVDLDRPQDMVGARPSAQARARVAVPASRVAGRGAVRVALVEPSRASTLLVDHVVARSLDQRAPRRAVGFVARVPSVAGACCASRRSERVVLAARQVRRAGASVVACGQAELDHRQGRLRARDGATTPSGASSRRRAKASTRIATPGADARGGEAGSSSSAQHEGTARH
jgi:hypothetical protein